jgi:predicted nucleic acid-binding protein
MKEYVLDAFAVLALLRGEAGAGRVRSLLAQAERGRARVAICLINAGEVYYTVARREGRRAAQRVRQLVSATAVEQVSVDDALIWEAAALKADLAISYAGAFALALAARRGAALVTGDRDFEAARDRANIIWL